MPGIDVRAFPYHQPLRGNDAARCVAGLTVIEAIEGERPIQNAAELGQLMPQELRNRLSPYPWSRDVGGSDLFIGLAVVRRQAGEGPRTDAGLQLSQRLTGGGMLVCVRREGDKYPWSEIHGPGP